TLDLWLGFRGHPLSYIGRYFIDGVSGEGGPDTMTISAAAIDLKSPIRAPRSRAWEDKTLQQIVETIAAEAGLLPVVGNSVATEHWPYLAQTAESDLNFLTRIAGQLDATAKAAAGRLVVARRGEGRTPAGDPIEALAIAPMRLRPGWRWELGKRDGYGSIEARWADMAGGETRSIIRGDEDPRRTLRHVYSSEAEAARAAEAELRRAARGTLKLDATLAGFEPALFAGGRIDLRGVRDPLQGEWHIDQVRHQLSDGLTTSLRARRKFDD
ncbi:MAG: phage tail protein, partial [Rhodobacter sp.]|nr:phage tail protein [Rhodobacter sp.]